MIKTIRIKNVASFDDDGISIDNLSRVNFIFGANATGKTTISKHLSEVENLQGEDFQVEWSDNFHEQVLVYNKQFKEDNFGQWNGVFTIGKVSKDEKLEIDKMMSELKGLDSKIAVNDIKIENQRENIKKEDEEFVELLWKRVYKNNEDVFKDAFKGMQNSKIILKREFLQRTENLSGFNYDREELTKQAKTIFGNTPTEMSPIRIFRIHEIESIESDPIWEKVIVGKGDVPIAGFIQKMNINDWINQGRKYISEDNNVCPFCQQETISEHFRKQLEAYFDKEFEEDIDKLKKLSEKYQYAVNTLMQDIAAILEREVGEQNTFLDLKSFDTLSRNLSNIYKENSELVKTKLKEPSRKIDLSPMKNVLYEMLSLVSSANESVSKHNEIVINHANEKKRLTREVLGLIRTENSDIIDKYLRKINGLNTGLTNFLAEREKLKADREKLNHKIIDANSKLTSIQPTVDRINEILLAYGFNSFHIVRSKDNDHCYELRRDDGSLVEDTLSEGEVSFITFLYFYHLCKGGKLVSELHQNRIIVIDDPVSSLDSNALFIICSLIKNLIDEMKCGNGNIRQFIVMTHNIFFHNEVSYHSPKKEEKKGYIPTFWILKKSQGFSAIKFYETNPITSHYKMLWKYICDNKDADIAMVPNAMRRILEYYFKFLGSYNEKTLSDKFADSNDKEIFKSLTLWLHCGSHDIFDPICFEPSGTVEQNMCVFKKIFELSGNIGHYEMMTENR